MLLLLLFWCDNLSLLFTDLMKICSGMAQLVERWVTEGTFSGPITIDKPTLRVFISRWNMIVLVIIILSRLLLRVTDITTTCAVVIFKVKTKTKTKWVISRWYSTLTRTVIFLLLMKWLLRANHSLFYWGSEVVKWRTESLAEQISIYSGHQFFNMPFLRDFFKKCSYCYPIPK